MMCSSSDPAVHGVTYKVRPGLYAEEAIKLLQDFYIAGNPAGAAVESQQVLLNGMLTL